MGFKLGLRIPAWYAQVASLISLDAMQGKNLAANPRSLQLKKKSEVYWPQPSNHSL